MNWLINFFGGHTDEDVALLKNAHKDAIEQVVAMDIRRCREKKVVVLNERRALLSTARADLTKAAAEIRKRKGKVSEIQKRLNSVTAQYMDTVREIEVMEA